MVASPITSGGASGGENTLDEGNAAATTTTHNLSTTAPMIIVPVPTTILHPPSSSRHHGDATEMVVDVTPALLPIMVMVSSHSSSGCGCGRSSEGPQRSRRCPVHPLPPPTVVEDRAAWHGGDRPAIFVNATLTTMPPRPGPASLLTSSLRPQQGRSTQRGSRVGRSLRAARTAGAGRGIVGGASLRAGGAPAAASVRPESIPVNVHTASAHRSGISAKAAGARPTDASPGIVLGPCASAKCGEDDEDYAHEGGWSCSGPSRPRSGSSRCLGRWPSLAVLR